jgi:hypothetical protein
MKGMQTTSADGKKVAGPSRGAVEKKRKFFVGSKEELTIQCLACKKTRTFDVARLKHRNHAFRFNCSCTETFDVALEFRESLRTRVHTPGSIRAESTPRERAKACVIADLSLGGLRLQTAEPLPIKKDDRLVVCFRPDDSNGEEIERLLSVCHISPGFYVGGKFLDA